MNCKYTKDDLILYVYDEFENRKKIEFEKHLKTCKSCLLELKKLKGTLNLCNKWKDIENIPGLVEKLMAKINKEDKSEERPIMPEKLDKLLQVLEKNLLEKNRLQKKFIGLSLSMEIMTIKQLSEYLKLEVEEIEGIIDEIPHFEVADQIRFRKKSIDKWLDLKEEVSKATFWDSSLKADKDITEFKQVNRVYKLI